MSDLTVDQARTLREIVADEKGPTGRFRKPRRRQWRTMRALERAGYIVDATELPAFPRWRLTDKGRDFAAGRL